MEDIESFVRQNLEKRAEKYCPLNLLWQDRFQIMGVRIENDGVIMLTGTDLLTTSPRSANLLKCDDELQEIVCSSLRGSYIENPYIENETKKRGKILHTFPVKVGEDDLGEIRLEDTGGETEIKYSSAFSEEEVTLTAFAPRNEERLAVEDLQEIQKVLGKIIKLLTDENN